jgi:outer membrane receptor for ferrienterochelin and colicin
VFEYEDSLIGEMNSKFSVSYHTVSHAFDQPDVQATLNIPVRAHYRSDRYLFKNVNSIDFDFDASFAFGFEFARNEFGRPSFFFVDTDPIIPIAAPAFAGGKIEQWHTTPWALFGEYQQQINDLVHFQVGLRADKHPNTKTLNSPKAAVILTPNSDNTIKLIYQRSDRRPKELSLKRTDFEGDRSKGETTTNYEIIVSHTFNDRLATDFSHYFVDSQFNAGFPVDTNQGDYKLWGLEYELKFQDDDWLANLSHSYTKLIDYKLTDPTTVHNQISSEPYGFGDDLKNWSNHNTKLYGRYKITPNLSADASLNILWGYPGAEAYVDYNNAGPQSTNQGLSDGRTDAFQESIFANLGLKYQLTDKLTIRADAINLAGWFDEDLNKRNAHQLVGSYRIEAPSFGFSIKYKFF